MRGEFVVSRPLALVELYDVAGQDLSSIEEYPLFTAYQSVEARVVR